MPGKTARALCPVCQEPMPPDETECENCGAFVIDEAVVRLCRALGIPREKALALFEKGFRHPKQLQDRNVDDVLNRGERGLLYICTNCGGFVASSDSKCSRCGAEFETEESAPPEEKDILDLVLCPVCGADNEPVWKECEICGEPLGGTEEPPGETPPPATSGETETPRPPPAPAAHPERPPEPPVLERIDDILKDLESPPPGKTIPRIRPIHKVHRTVKPPKATSRPRPIRPQVPKTPNTPAPPTRTPPRATPAPRPMPRRTIRPIAKPPPVPTEEPRRVPSVVEASAPSPSPVSRRRGWRLWTSPPPEFTGGVVVAGAASLYVASLVGELGIAWGTALVLAILGGYVLLTDLLHGGLRIPSVDGALLSAGALLGALVPAAPAAYAPAVAVAGAVPLAVATRRLLRSSMRDLLAVASAASPIALGFAAALRTPMAGTPAWAFGLLAATPWPAAVVLAGVWQRRSALALHHELSKAEKAVAREDYSESLREYDRAIALTTKATPGGDVPWYGKGATLILLGRYEEALRAIDTALDLNPRNEVAWLNKGNALTKMGRLVDALRCFNAAIKVNPRYEVAWNNKGNTLARLGHLDEALRCYERALSIDADYRGAWVNKGYVLTKLGRYDEATTCADRALRLNEAGRSEAA